MNQNPKPAIIKKNSFYSNNQKSQVPFFKKKSFRISLICAVFIINLIFIWWLNKDDLQKPNTDENIKYLKMTRMHLTAIFSGMFLGGTILGLKKGSFGVSLGIFVGATLGMWLSLLTYNWEDDKNIITIIINIINIIIKNCP